MSTGEEEDINHYKTTKARKSFWNLKTDLAMLWSQARVQQDTKDNRIIVNLNRPAKMFSSSLFTLVRTKI